MMTRMTLTTAMRMMKKISHKRKKKLKMMEKRKRPLLQN
jgi:hypothetical protein